MEGGPVRVEDDKPGVAPSGDARPSSGSPATGGVRRGLARPVALLALLLAAVAGAAALLAPDRGERTPPGFASAAGRLEADQVDIASRHFGRVATMAVREGDLVAPGAVLAEIDVAELEAALDRAEAEAALAREMKAEAEALAVQRQSELRRADHDLDRARPLLDRGHLTPADFEVRETARDVAAAALRAAEAGVATAGRRILAQEAEVRRIAAQIADGVLRAPAEARVLYRLAEPGEVAPAGRALLTLLSLENVYMEVFLPAREAALTPIGAEARIVLDALPDYAIPAAVSFVSPEAQFTPRQVETLGERETLMFRVRVRIPPELLRGRSAQVKTGVRGVAHIRLDASAPWPERLERRIPPAFFE